MVVRRIVINDDNDEVLKPGDRIVDWHPGRHGEGWEWVTVDRDVSDEPTYRPGDAGTATVENNYGVALPDQAGVWVRRGDEMIFSLFEVKRGRRAIYPPNRVSDFVPALTAGEQFTALVKERGDLSTENTRLKRRLGKTEEALEALVNDLHLLRAGGGGVTPMTTAAGATMKRWLARRDSDDQ